MSDLDHGQSHVDYLRLNHLPHHHQIIRQQTKHTTITTFTPRTAIMETKPSVKRTVLRSFPLEQFPGWESRLVLLEFEPGVIGPPHTHPVQGLAYVLKGSVTSQFEGSEVEVYHEGETMIDLADTAHVAAGNASKTEQLKLLVSYVIKIGQPNVVMS